MIDAQNERGHLSYGEYAHWLNDEGYRTRRGHRWTGRQVSRIYERILGAKRPKNRA
ncbi:recombinase family protein [Dyella japonica]|uniref:recombinase family protein n=1 Tax=Dyella japonica TaxID=231455 RepID=UPI003CCDCEA8